MTTQKRRVSILADLKASKEAINATSLAKKYKVSRQSVVGDIAILKAQKEPIMATVRGYIYLAESTKQEYRIACIHDKEDTEKELQLIVDYGGVILNVIVNHPIYGELCGNLNISSRHDIDMFIEKSNEAEAKNLSQMSDGIHIHTLHCEQEEDFDLIKLKLKEAGFLYE